MQKIFGFTSQCIGRYSNTTLPSSRDVYKRQAIFAACFGSIKHILFRKLRYDNEEDIQPKKRSEKIIISISDETSEWLELYCKTNGIFRKDFVSLPLDYFERTGFDLQYSVLDYFPLEKIIGELCWVHNCLLYTSRYWFPNFI